MMFLKTDLICDQLSFGTLIKLVKLVCGGKKLTCVAQGHEGRDNYDSL